MATDNDDDDDDDDDDDYDDEILPCSISSRYREFQQHVTIVAPS